MSQIAFNSDKPVTRLGYRFTVRDQHQNTTRVQGETSALDPRFLLSRHWLMDFCGRVRIGDNGLVAVPLNGDQPRQEEGKHQSEMTHDRR